MSGKTKLIALIVKKLFQLLTIAGLHGYSKTKSFRDKVQNLVVKVIPTKIDDRIIQYDQIIEDELVKLADQLAHDIYVDFLDGTDVINADLDVDNLMSGGKLKSFIEKVKRNRQMYQISANKGLTPKDEDDRGRFKGGRSLSNEEKDARRKEREEGRKRLKEATGISRREGQRKTPWKEAKERQAKERERYPWWFP